MNPPFPLLVVLCGLAVASNPVEAAVFEVNYYAADLADPVPGDGVCDALPAVPGPQCTLRAAVMTANALPNVGGPDRVRLYYNSTTTLAIPSGGGGSSSAADGDLNITDDLVIEPENSILVAADDPVIDGADNVSLFKVEGAGTTLTLRGLILRGSTDSAVRAPGVEQHLSIDGVRFEDNRGISGGGAISIGSALGLSTLEVIDSDFVNNNSLGNGGAIFAGMRANVTIDHSSFRGNTATEGHGAAIRISDSFPDASFVIRNSLLTSPGALIGTNRGGISFEGSGSLEIRNTTLVDFNNRALRVDASPSAEVRVFNSVFSNVSGAGPDCEVIAAAATIIEFDYNLIEDGSCAAVAGANLETGAADLEPLAQVSLSPAFYRAPSFPGNLIDAGQPLVAEDSSCEGTDQLGTSRPQDGDGNGSARCDLGAVEGAGGGLFIVNHTAADLVDADPGDGVCNVGFLDLCTLRAAVMEANASPGPDVIRFQEGTGPVTLTIAGIGGAHEGDLDITESVTIEGNISEQGRAGSAVLQNVAGERLFEVSTDQPVALRYLNLSGTGSGTNLSGGGLRANGAGTVRIEHTQMANLRSNSFGGAISVLNGSLFLVDVDLHGNTSEDEGAALYVADGAFASVSDTSIWDNDATGAGNTAAVYMETGGLMTMGNSTVAYNSGGIVAVAPLNLSVVQSTLVNNDTRALNVAFQAGPSDRLFLRSSILAGNGIDDCQLVNTAAANELIRDAYNLIQTPGLGCTTGLTNQFGTAPAFQFPSPGELTRPLGQTSRVLPPALPLFPNSQSPVIDRVPEGENCLNDDQLSTQRPQQHPLVIDVDGPCDRGAVEYIAPTPPLLGEGIFSDGFESP